MTREVKLTDDTGTELTSANTSGLNSGLYQVVFGAGASDYAYIGLDGLTSLRLESVNVYVLTDVALSGGIQYYKEGTITNDAQWINKSAHDFTIAAGGASMTYNNVLSADEVVDGTPMRVKLTAAGACTVHIKVLKK